MRNAMSIPYSVEDNGKRSGLMLRMFSRYGSIATKNNTAMFRKIVIGLPWSIFDMMSLVPHQMTTKMMKLKLNKTSPPTTSVMVFGFAAVRDSAPTASANPNTAVVSFSIGEFWIISFP